MQQYNVFQAIIMSFYSKKLYRDVAQNWGGKAFLYLFLLLTFVSVYFALATQKVTQIAYDNLYTAVSPQVPEMKIKDGKLSTPENRPYFITSPDKKNIAIIDTSGKYKTLEQAETYMLVTQTEVMVQKDKGETRIYNIPSGVEQTIVPEQVDKMIDMFLGYPLWIIFFLVFLFAFYIYRVFQALVYSLIGKVFAVIFKVNVTYGQIIQIMLVAITPAIIIATIQFAVGFVIPLSMLFYFVVAMAYLFYGILANK